MITQPGLLPKVLHAPRPRAGGQDTVTVLLGRSGGLTAPIALSIDSGRTGITGTFSPNPALDDASLLTVRVAADVPAGDYKVRMRAIPQAGSGAAEATLTLAFTVDPLIVPGTYTLTTPNVVVVGNTATTSTLGVVRSGGFIGAVTVGFAQANSAALPSGWPSLSIQIQ